MRLGVLITYHNEAALLTDCLQSLLAQDGRPDEVLIYDDASVERPDRYVPTGFRVRIIRADRNQGPAAGRNLLLSLATSEYVHLHDADDLFHPDWCREVRAAIRRSKPDIVLTEIASVRDGVPVSKRVLGVNAIGVWGDLVRFGLGGSLLVPSTTFRCSLGLQVGGFRTRDVLAQSEDFDFHIRLAAAARSLEVVDRPLIIQRLRAGSHSEDMEACWISAVRATELLAGALPARYRFDIADAAARFGSQLYSIRSYAEARHAFDVARRIGPARFKHRPWHYRLVARAFGAHTAEALATAYHALVPQVLRERVRR